MGAVKLLVTIFAVMILTFLGLSRVIAREDPEAFVQRFYDWYAPRAGDIEHPFGFEDALNLKPSVFDPPLARALQADADAQKKARDIVGLDFDPILNSQDPDSKYRAGKAIRTVKGYRVDVYETDPNYVRQRNGKPAVIVDLAPRGDSWVIVNFEYDDPKFGHDDVLDILQQLAQDRASRSTTSH
jgi:hypothetical protein